MLSNLESMSIVARNELLEYENNELASQLRLTKVEKELLEIKLAKANRKLNTPVLINNG